MPCPRHFRGQGVVFGARYLQNFLKSLCTYKLYCTARQWRFQKERRHGHIGGDNSTSIRHCISFRNLSSQRMLCYIWFLPSPPALRTFRVFANLLCHGPNSSHLTALSLPRYIPWHLIDILQVHIFITRFAPPVSLNPFPSATLA